MARLSEIGEQDGRFFFSMEFVAGRNLLEIIQENPLPPGRAGPAGVPRPPRMPEAAGGTTLAL